MKAFAKSHPYIVLFLFSAFLFLIGNNLLPITDTAESNYALTAKEMVLSGDWISPQIYGNYWYDKPIFYYWELAGSFVLFGFNEFAARFPSAVMGILSVLFTFWFTRRAYDEKTAWIASAIFSTSIECFLLSKAIITDATLFLFMSGAIACFYFGYTEKRIWYYGCYIFAALATLTKGPIGLFLPGLGAILFLLYRKDFKEMLRVHLISGMALFLIITGSWYGTMWMLHGNDFILNFLGVHNFLRATVSEHPSQNNWYFYILVYLIGFFPWSLILPVSLFTKWKSGTLSLRKAAPASQLLFLYAVGVQAFFALVATKYITYTFPALFSLAILTATLYKNVTIRIERAAFASIPVYAILALFVAPGIMMNCSGKEVGMALRQIDTGSRPICAFDKYRTSAVFYSGKTIYDAVPASEIDELKPGSLSWNAKNVMPFISKETALSENAVILTQDKNNDRFMSALAPTTSKVSRQIILPGEYTIWFTGPVS